MTLTGCFMLVLPDFNSAIGPYYHFASMAAGLLPRTDVCVHGLTFALTHGVMCHVCLDNLINITLKTAGGM